MKQFESCCDLTDSQKKEACIMLRVTGDINEDREKRQTARDKLRLLVGSLIWDNTKKKLQRMARARSLPAVKPAAKPAAKSAVTIKPIDKPAIEQAAQPDGMACCKVCQKELDTKTLSCLDTRCCTDRLNDGSDSRPLRAVARAARAHRGAEPRPMPSPIPVRTDTAADQHTAKKRKATASTVASHTLDKYFSRDSGDNEDNEVEEQRPHKKKSPGTITDVGGTVHKLPSASRLAINQKLYAATQVTNPRGYKPCARCSFPCGMRAKKCMDKKNCQFSMIKPMTYRTDLSPEELHAAAVLRIKADYDEVVDSVIIYEGCEKESQFVDDRHLVLPMSYVMLVS